MALFRSLINFSIDKIKVIWTIFLTIFSLISVLLPDYKLYFLLFCIFVIWSMVVFIQHFIILKKRKIEISSVKNRNFYIMMNGFIENLEININDASQQNKRLAVAVGIDQSLEIISSTDGSIMNDLISYLKSKKLSLEKLQTAINNSFKNQFKQGNTPKLGDIIRVTLEIENKPIDFLFVVNSRKKTEYYDKNMIHGEDSRIIIIKLFNKCTELKFEQLMLGAIGTNKLEFPYKTIITEIINAFVFCKDKPKTVFLSLREQDMKEQNLELRDIVSFTTQSMKFISR
ncbi:hypothetical protein [Streptococcus parauberis]|uniref:hypothetical protein n=1 Tax=Streptococcus parauberis TaxID=1348 RepID=UPI000CCED716|nr:hypothetical protein [Streptococcus parauberis]PNY20234.1 hypothetical protein ASN86_00444 [Streptococcus parauberis]